MRGFRFPEKIVVVFFDVQKQKQTKNNDMTFMFTVT